MGNGTCVSWVQLAALGAEQLASLSVEQLNALSQEQLGAFNAGHRGQGGTAGGRAK